MSGDLTPEAFEEFVERFVRLGYEPRKKLATIWLATKRAPRQIRLVLRAIEDGALPLRKVPPKLPGELGRHGDHLKEMTLLTWILKMSDEGATRFIAFAPAEAMDLVEMIENLEAHLESLNEFLAREGIVPRGEEEKA